MTLKPFFKVAVATVLTVYGIETRAIAKATLRNIRLQQYLPFTVLKRKNFALSSISKSWRLQQYLPFTVLKLISPTGLNTIPSWRLQQYLPFTVLKLAHFARNMYGDRFVATVLTVYGIETKRNRLRELHLHLSVATVLTVYGIET